MSDRDSLRGVPFRLSKKFYPLIRPQFRDIDIHIPIDALEEDYDFSLERQMIVKHDAFLEEKERLRIKYEERLAEEKRRQEELAAAAAIEAAAQAERLAHLLIEQAKLEAPAITQNEAGETIGSEEQTENRQSNDEEKVEEVPTPNLTVINPQPAHREPLPFAIPKPDKPDTKANVAKGAQAQSGPSQRKVNVSLSDFEADTGSPFDSAELKSMNDKAELASIWGKLQDQQRQVYAATNASRSSPASVSAYPMHQSQMQATAWNNQLGRNPNGSLYYQAVPMAPSCSPVPVPASPLVNNSLIRPNSNHVLRPPATTIESSLNQSTGITTANAMQSSQANPSVSSSNSFTKLHFPFLSSYTQANTRDRELERELERSYHQHYQQQLNISSSAPPPAGPGFSPAMMHQRHQPSLSSSTSASNLQNIPNNYTASAAAVSGVNSSHNLQNQAHNNFVLGHNYHWPLTTTHTPPYEYSHLQQPTKK